jgi:sugar lactone lactonase YvrE
MRKPLARTLSRASGLGGARLAAIFLALPALLLAVKTGVWDIAEYKDFLPGKLENLTLDREGRLRLAPALETALETEEAAIWSLVRAADGKLYAGTGHQGKLLVIDADGKSKVLWKAPEIEIFALAIGPDGKLYAGTAPNGKVYRVSEDGKADEVFDPKQAYVWALRFIGKDLFVATGDSGKIFRVTPDGKGEEYFDTGQRHVISLAVDADGKLLAGTDPSGVLYRIDGPGKAFALYDSDLPEIRAIDVAPDGAIRFAAMGGAISLRDQTVQSVSSAATFSVTATATTGSPGTAAPGATQTVVSTPQQPSAAYSQPVINYGVETGAVFELRPGRGVKKLWTSKEENVLALTADPADPRRLLFATDQSGRLYRLYPSGATELLNQTERQALTTFAPVPDGAILSATHPGAVLRLSKSPGQKGVYRTAVRDAGRMARWGRLEWEGAGNVELQTRSGNSEEPDASWSDWSAPLTQPGGGAIASPPARYIQWRATLKADGDPPVLERVRVSYLPRNDAPVIESISVSGEASMDSSSTDSSSTSSSDSQATYSVTVSASGATSMSSGASSTKESNVGGGAQRKLAISWSADDPNGDELVAAVEFRGDGEQAWKTLRDEVIASKVTIDSDALADGRYLFRVRVNDGRSNPPDSAEEAEKVSSATVVDHTPPMVTVMEVRGSEGVRFEARDATSALAGAEYSIDAGPWTPVWAEDGVADSQSETFFVKLAAPAAKETLVAIRVRDRAGNAGLAKALVK